MPVVALGPGLTGGDVRTKKSGVAEIPEPREGVLFKMGFGDAGGRGHHRASLLYMKTCRFPS